MGDGTYGDGTYGDGQPATASGAQVLDTVVGSPAAAAGIAAGDVITSVGGQAVDSSSALTAALQSSHPGDKTTVRWTDPGGQTHSATVTLARGAAD